MGTSLRSEDYTQASIRGLENALWHNSLNIAEAFNFPKERMIIEVEIGVQKPEKVDIDRVKKVIPYGSSKINVCFGGLDIIKSMELKSKFNNIKKTVIANVAIIVFFDMEKINDKL